LRHVRPRHEGFDLQLDLVEETGTRQLYAFSFSTYSEELGDFKTVEGRYYRTLAVAPGEPAPLLLVSPILAGPRGDFITCRVFSAWAAEAGYSAFFLQQNESVLSSDRDARDLVAYVREDVRDHLKALDLLSARPDVDADRLGSFGISLGAIKNVVLIAAEPRLVANVLCLGGADLPDILMHSQEPAVIRYLQRRCEKERRTLEQVAEDLRVNLRWDPAKLAPTISNERVLLFLGSLDNKVPYRNGQQLREHLGRPETFVVPFGHYTALLAAPYARARSFRFFARRFTEVARTR